MYNRAVKTLRCNISKKCYIIVITLAKEKNISISGLKDLEEIKWELKKHLLAGCRKRDDVNILFFSLASLTAAGNFSLSISSSSLAMVQCPELSHQI
jgi:hypothetical protein